MEVTVTEFQALADAQSQQALTIAQLTRKLEEKERENAVLHEENYRLKGELEAQKMVNAAATFENLLLKNYIMLSVEKIRQAVKKLKVEKFALIKTFIEWVLPPEHMREQLLLVNELMSIPDEQAEPVRNITLTGSNATYNENNDKH